MEIFGYWRLVRVLNMPMAMYLNIGTMKDLGKMDWTFGILVLMRYGKFNITQVVLSNQKKQT